MPGDVKSHNTTSKPGFSGACFGLSRGYENHHLPEGKFVGFTRACFVVWHLERLVIFDDELPAVSALYRPDLKMAERPKAKLS